MNRQTLQGLALALMIGASATALNASAQTTAPASATAAQPWLDPKLDADTRADLAVKAMTQDEKLTLVFGYFGADMKPKYTRIEGSLPGSAGYVKGIPRLGIPEQWETDAGIGVATQGSAKEFRERTALPSGMATTATWNPELAYKGGAMIGSEARNSGFNVMLAGGVNLVREPRNGRNFEYGGEDPLLAATMVAAQIKGIQSNNIVSTIKHYALNNQETGRFILSANIDQTSARMSDLLAFQLAMEQSDPHSVMCAYNRVNSVYACENDWLLNTVLKQDFGFKGYVMSDWGAVHSGSKAVNAGLDQQSAGEAFDKQNFLGSVLKADLASGAVSGARLDDMARRVTRALFASGAVDKPVKIAPIDFTANGKITQADAEEAIVLLKNDRGLLPLAKTARTIAIIGAHADVGVLSGGGSSQVYPVGGRAMQGLEPATWPGPVIYYPSSPMKALQARYPGAKITFHDGKDPAAAAKLAAASDLAIVFADQWTTESEDVWTLNLPKNQDATIAAVAAANTKTIVVLETGGPVLMPWLNEVGAVVQAWFPGTSGGEAIARVLTGEVDASGRLPVTFPKDVAQLPRPKLDGDPKAPETPFDVDYTIEGAAVGYKWFDKKGHEPLFPFGYGLSYTSFGYSDLKTSEANGVLTVSFSVTNTGTRTGKAVPQVYVSPKAGGWEAPKRLAGFKKVELAPGASTVVSLTVDPRLVSVWDDKAHGWSIAAGDYDVALGASSRALSVTSTVTLKAQALPVSPRAR
ncbi:MULTISPECIES: beta-glucosidase family protein [unclassified Caulobacter]|uniref:beta-glucosidase family protein n=1 Tax=unclassified Caulobacter TaxID=2648921 RepID=UPI000D3AE32A|nr:MULTISPECIES: glycoside hydrolase family 3 protein [unclassified Caulobacter]PTS91256.1 glycosyl hydrolase [Caulobacter sp. HMWF009]PTT10280.1 glycosyl hydrolase [Caulobacter sp. HMWF025]